MLAIRALASLVFGGFMLGVELRRVLGLKPGAIGLKFAEIWGVISGL